MFKKTTKTAPKLRDASLTDTLEEFRYGLYAWVILDNHYHILFNVRESGHLLSKFVNLLHGRTSNQINKFDNMVN